MKKIIEQAQDVVEINVIESPNSPVTIISKCTGCENWKKKDEIEWM